MRFVQSETFDAYGFSFANKWTGGAIQLYDNPQTTSVHGKVLLRLGFLCAATEVCVYPLTAPLYKRDAFKPGSIAG